jgi:hypothetical protein
MEGAEGFDFFRQPDFVKDPFLKGSYAVYKKETLTGEGTGKLCHIHRPEIIDSRGRRVWGDLYVTGNELRITIPEEWLSKAKYPVVVDPTIGTTTVGSQTHWNNTDNESYDQLFIEMSLAVNRFLVSETLNGTATAYVYAYESDYEGRCKPVFYSDNNNVPLSRRSAAEGSFDIAVGGGKPAGWRSAAFSTNTSIASGAYIWFGLFCDWFAPRFDYGAKCYRDYWYDSGNDIPNSFPLYQANHYYNFKLSMYFAYTSAQNYTRTLAQGVTLTDTRKQIAAYNRAVTVNADSVTLLGRGANYYRDHVAGIAATDTLGRFRAFFIALAEQVRAAELVSRCRDFLRTIALTVRAGATGKRNLAARRGSADLAGAADGATGLRGFIRNIVTTLGVSGCAGKVFNRLCRIREEVAALGEAGRRGDYLRGLYSEAGNMAETARRAGYYRKQQDAAYSEGLPLRRLFIFLRLLTASHIRDYITGRFLRSKEEVVIKSKVTREIVLDSSLH